jgi:hypothetical protein
VAWSQAGAEQPPDGDEVDLVDRLIGVELAPARR